MEVAFGGEGVLGCISMSLSHAIDCSVFMPFEATISCGSFSGIGGTGAEAEGRDRGFDASVALLALRVA